MAVLLISGCGGGGGGSDGSVSSVDTSPTPPNDALPTVSVFGTRVTESQSRITPARFSVALSEPSGLEVAVDYYTVDGTATRNQDFEFSQGTLTIHAGETVGTIVVPVLGDTIEEAEESFELVLENASNATLAVSSALGIIGDDDALRTATLIWEAPVTNVDGSCVDDLDGYRVHAGNRSRAYRKREEVTLSSGELICEQTDFDTACSAPVMTCRYTMVGLTRGTWFFAIQAFDRGRYYSPFSEEVSGEIP